MEKVKEIPARHLTAIPLANVVSIVIPKKLHPHNREYEDDDTKHKSKVGKGRESYCHNLQDVIE